LQQEEVESIHAVSIDDLYALFKEEVEIIACSDGTKLRLSDFVPHETEYFNAIADMLKATTS
ncbi:MAG TPA: hypothetical protein VFX34_08770, partial [Sporosarcina sp.]|nr:hypothetical protein [Sporosarcina sp.]